MPPRQKTDKVELVELDAPAMSCRKPGCRRRGKCVCGSAAKPRSRTTRRRWEDPETEALRAELAERLRRLAISQGLGSPNLTAPRPVPASDPNTKEA